MAVCPTDTSQAILQEPVGRKLFSIQQVPIVGGGTCEALVPIINVVPTGATAGTLTVAISTATGAGSTTADILSLSIANQGAADGLVDGDVLIPGGSINIEATMDYVTGEFKYVPSVSYDATGTSFLIKEES